MTVACIVDRWGKQVLNVFGSGEDGCVVLWDRGGKATQRTQQGAGKSSGLGLG